MSLKHAILGFLSISPKTGYDLQKKIELTIQHFWPSTQSQIYRTLKELENESLIQCEVHYQSEKPNKKMYSLTNSGEKELADWLSKPLKLSSHRNQFLVQLFFSKSMNSAIIIANLYHYQQELSKSLGFLKSDNTQLKVALGKTPQEKVLYQIIVENGIRALESEISWVDDAVIRFRELDQKTYEE